MELILKSSIGFETGKIYLIKLGKGGVRDSNRTLFTVELELYDCIRTASALNDVIVTVKKVYFYNNFVAARYVISIRNLAF